MFSQTSRNVYSYPPICFRLQWIRIYDTVKKAFENVGSKPQTNNTHISTLSSNLCLKIVCCFSERGWHVEKSQNCVYQPQKATAHNEPHAINFSVSADETVVKACTQCNKTFVLLQANDCNFSFRRTRSHFKSFLHLEMYTSAQPLFCVIV